MDVNQDGFLNAEQLVAGMYDVRANLFELLDKDPDWQNVLKDVNSSEDGRLDYEEFAIATFKRRKALNERNLWVALDLLESNRDGRIDRDEFNQYFAETTLDDLTMHELEMNQASWTRILNACDTMQEGWIERMDLLQHLTEHIESQNPQTYSSSLHHVSTMSS